jgi:hypothetical protein
VPLQRHLQAIYVRKPEKLFSTRLKEHLQAFRTNTA